MYKLKELENQIVNELDKVLFKESLICLESKTFRAGYIIAWVSIVESLKRKIYALANTGDIQSNQSMEKIVALEKDGKSADVPILKEALAISLIENDEYNKLSFLWTQRCVFAHPYEKAPTEDDLIYIIKQATVITLCKELEFKKNFIHELIINLTTKSHFLSNDDVAIQNYALTIIPKINTDLHSYFYKCLIAKIGEIHNNPTKKISLKRLRIFSSNLLLMTDQDLNKETWRMEYFALNYTYEFALASCNYLTWSKIPKRCKEMLIEYSLITIADSARFHISKILAKIYKNGKFNNEFEDKFEKFIASINIQDSYSFYKNEKDLFDRIIIELNSGDYYRQQNTIIILRSDFGINFQNKISVIKSIEIGRRITKAAERGCFEAKGVLTNNHYGFNENFKVGILVGAFVDIDLTFRFDYNTLFTLFPLIEIPTIATAAISYIANNKVIVSNPHSIQAHHLEYFKSNIGQLIEYDKLSDEIITFLKEIYNTFLPD